MTCHEMGTAHCAHLAGVSRTVMLCWCYSLVACPDFGIHSLVPFLCYREAQYISSLGGSLMDAKSRSLLLLLSSFLCCIHRAM